jgi:serine/threonine protein kinase
MTPTTTSDRFAPGARIGDYEVEREVAYEETAVVYLATHVVLPRKSYLKVAHPASRSAAVHLLRQACILEALSHAGIPRVHECGVLADRRPWCAIEVMPGVKLSRVISDGRMSLSDLIVALRDLADILRHAHERGVVHGRLTAGAIVRMQRRRYGHAICDWGDAHTLDSEADVVVDPRDDIHALGGIAFRALTGAPPSPSRSAAAHCPAAPPDLTTLIDQMMAEPVARPSASDVFARLVWLCNTLEIAPLIERPRWTPPQGCVSERISSNPESDGFVIRIGRPRTS